MTSKRAFLPWSIVLLVILSVGAIRVRLLDTPLERDEGEYALLGQMMLDGIPPYKLAWFMKLPGTYAAYAAIMAVFGQSPSAIHLGLLLVNAGAIVLVFLLGRRLFDTEAGLVACASYALLSVGQSVLGVMAHATHFVILAALGATLLLLRTSESSRAAPVFWSGLLFGIAFLMKQQGIVFAVFGALYLLALHKPWKHLALFAAAVGAPYGLTCLLLWRAGVFEKFWFWTVTFARVYETMLPPSEVVSTFWNAVQRLVAPNFLLWLLAAVGLVWSLWKPPNGSSVRSAALFLLFSFLAVCPGFYFRSHYFVLMLPAVALFIGAAVTAPGRIWGAAIFVAVLGFSVLEQREFLFQMTPLQASRAMYKLQPFPEAIPLANYVRDHTSKQSRIAVLGSEPEIYFYAHRYPASGYIYTYTLLEIQPFALAMQKEFIRGIEEIEPEYIVFVNSPYSWLPSKSSERMVFDWWQAYGPRHYKAVGYADLLSPEQTEYRWDADAEHYTPDALSSLVVFKRVTIPRALSRQDQSRALAPSLSKPQSVQ